MASNLNANPPDDPILFTFFNEVGIIEQLSRNAFERMMPNGMTVPQFSVLNHFVRLGGPKTPAQLASAFQVNRATMTNTLKRLKERGFISAARDERDGRSKQIDITDAGRKARDEAVKAVAPLLEDFASRMPMDRLKAILPVLQAVRADLDAERDAPRVSRESPSFRRRRA